MANGPVGVNVIERPAATAPAIIPADVTNTGILIESQRGLVNKPINISSVTEARLRFGIPQSSLGRYGALAIRGLFRNAAPFTARLFVSRIVGTGSAAAESIFTSGDAQFAAKAGGPGTPANYTVTIETGTSTGKKFTFKDDAGSPTVTEVFDDVETPQQLADAVNRGLAGFGSGSISDGDPSGLIVVNYVGGVLPDNLTETALGADLLLDAPVAAAVNSIIAAGQLGLEDVGLFGNALRVTITPTVGAEYLRDMEIVEVVSGENVSRETFTNLGFDDTLSNFFANVLNSPDVGSNFVAVTTIGALPNPVTAQALTGGLDGADPVLGDFIGDESAGSGLFAFDGEPISMVTTPDLTSVEMADGLEEYAAGRGDVIAVASTDFGLSIDTLESDWSTVLFKQKSFLAVYRSWIQVDDGFGGRVFVPNVGHVLGAGYVRRMLSKSQFPHIAPAGLDVDVRDALDLEFRNLSQSQLDRLVNEVGINPVMFVANRGFVIRTSRTFSSLSPNFSAHIRRSLNFIITSLNDNLGFLEQEPNNDTTRGRVRQVLTAFFTTLFNAGMFETRGGFANNIAVKCDEENNSISVVNQRKLVVDITLRFVEIAQTIEVNLQATREGIIITEVAA